MTPSTQTLCICNLSSASSKCIFRHGHNGISGVRGGGKGRLEGGSLAEHGNIHSRSISPTELAKVTNEIKGQSRAATAPDDGRCVMAPKPEEPKFFYFGNRELPIGILTRSAHSLNKMGLVQSQCSRTVLLNHFKFVSFKIKGSFKVFYI